VRERKFFLLLRGTRGHNDDKLFRKRAWQRSRPGTRRCIYTGPLRVTEQVVYYARKYRMRIIIVVIVSVFRRRPRGLFRYADEYEK